MIKERSIQKEIWQNHLDETNRLLAEMEACWRRARANFRYAPELRSEIIQQYRAELTSYQVRIKKHLAEYEKLNLDNQERDL